MNELNSRKVDKKESMNKLFIVAYAACAGVHFPGIKIDVNMR